MNKYAKDFTTIPTDIRKAITKEGKEKKGNGKEADSQPREVGRKRSEISWKTAGTSQKRAVL